MTMTVEDLIKKLQGYDKDAVVKLHHPEGEEALFVVAHVNDSKQVWLETESDNDMVAEISAELEAVKEGKLSINELYTNIGIARVRKYLGDDEADDLISKLVVAGLMKPGAETKEANDCCEITSFK